jgi:hypothetical protein
MQRPDFLLSLLQAQLHQENKQALNLFEVIGFEEIISIFPDLLEL